MYSIPVKNVSRCVNGMLLSRFTEKFITNIQIFSLHKIVSQTSETEIQKNFSVFNWLYNKGRVQIIIFHVFSPLRENSDCSSEPRQGTFKTKKVISLFNNILHCFKGTISPSFNFVPSSNINSREATALKDGCAGFLC